MGGENELRIPPGALLTDLPARDVVRELNRMGVAAKVRPDGHIWLPYERNNRAAKRAARAQYETACRRVRAQYEIACRRVRAQQVN